MSKPITVGITGGIGAGKTLVTNLFKLLHVPVYDADSRAKRLMNNLLQKPITSLFGSDSYSKGVLNRNFIASQIFNNSDKLNALNAIVHPAVAIDFEDWKRQHNDGYVLKEAALLIESGSYKQLDKLIIITSPIALRIARIKKRDVFRSEKEIKNIIASQMPEIEKVKHADFIISNDEQLMLLPQVLVIDKKIRTHF